MSPDPSHLGFQMINDFNPLADAKVTTYFQIIPLFDAV